jgi:spermidine synthase
MSATLIPIFFLSGFAALAFEALWFRLASLSLGNSVWSATLVLAAFMGGLSLGNALVARLHRRIARPVQLYAVLELAIGIGGLAVVVALPRLSAAFGPLLTALVDTPWLLNAARLAIAFIVLAIPTTAMGATLPVLAEALSRSSRNFGANLGKLYGWNTLGAMLGAISTELVLVRLLGIANSGLFATALNLTAALIALRLARSGERPAPTAAVDAGARPALSSRAYRYLTVGFLSGAAMLALEVVWFRFLLLTYTGTGLVFALMLTVVLAGIGLGGLAAGRISQRDERCHRWLRLVTATSAALVVLAYAGCDLFTVRQIEDPLSLSEFVALAAFLMLPVALLSGAAFTMVARGVNQELGSSARAAGITALWNTVGSMAGSLGAGFVLLPFIGMERSFFVLAALYCGTALLAPPDEERRSVRLAAWVATALAAACLVVFPFGLMQRSFFMIVQRALPDHTLVATREGLVETVRYYRRDLFGAPFFYRLITNGYSMSATTTAAKRYMKLYVYLPIALRAEARDALLVSFGVGSTAKALTDSAGLRHIDVVDISRDILDMSSIVYPGDDNPLRDPRVRVHVEDGRFFLSTTTRKYDLITSEPPPPKVAGVVNLYTEEYFRLIHAHLAPGGYATYWLPVHELQPLDTLAIIKAFCAAFEDCSLWSGGGLEWMLMGSNRADAPVSADSFSAQWRDSRVRPELTALGFETPEQMGSLFMADASELASVTADVRPLTDNHPLRLSDRLVLGRERVPLYAKLMDEDRRLELFRRSSFIASRWPPELKERSEPFFRYERMIKNDLTDDLYRDEHDPFLWAAIDDVLTNTSLQTLPLWLLGTGRVEQQMAEELSRGGTSRPDIVAELAAGALARRDFPGALDYARRAMADGHNLSVGEVSMYVYLLAKTSTLAEARNAIDSIDQTRVPEIRAFREWFDATYGPSATASHATRRDATLEIATR